MTDGLQISEERTDFSIDTKDLFAALSLAQSGMVGAARDSANPFFKSKYADLASAWDACRAQLTTNGLAVFQAILDAGSRNGILCETILTHSSGQWIRFRTFMPAKGLDAQAYGSAATYARRYALMAAVGLAPVDDDGNAASGKNSGNGHVKPEPIIDHSSLYEKKLLEYKLSDSLENLKVLFAEVRASNPDYCSRREAILAELTTTIKAMRKEATV